MNSKELKHKLHIEMGKRFRKQAHAYRWLYDVLRCEHVSVMTCQEIKNALTRIKELQPRHRWENYKSTIRAKTDE